MSNAVGRMWANLSNTLANRTKDPVFRGVDNREGGTLWEDEHGLFLRYPQRKVPVEWRLVSASKPKDLAQVLQVGVFEHQQYPVICVFRAPDGEMMHRHMTLLG